MFDLDSGAEQRLDALRARVRDEMRMLSFATKPWVTPVTEGGIVIPDIIIIGAGQSGLSAGLELKRRGVTNVVVLDANPAGYEGVWETYARNYEIRSPKDITGMDGGLPALSIEAFVVARHGQPAWDHIKRIPRTVWMAYLRWFRSCVDLDIRNDTRVADIDFDGTGVTLTLSSGDIMRGRQVVLATGMEGGGHWRTPDFVKETLPRHVWNHSSDMFDAAKLSGKRVAVLGAGAAAFDMAVTSLEAGASQVDMFLRRRQLPMRDVIRELENGGYLVHAERVPDAEKWEISKYMSGLSQAPAEHHFHKACTYEHFNIHLGSPWQDVTWTGSEISIQLPGRQWHGDHVFTATGVTVDMSLRPELARLQAQAALWRDRFVPPDGDQDSPRLNFPYLDGHYRFTPREMGTAHGIDRIFAFNALAGMSMGGLSAVSIGAFRFGTRKLVDALAERLFDEQIHKLVPYLDTIDAPGVSVPANMQTKLDAEMRRLVNTPQL